MTPPLNARIARAVAGWPERDAEDFQARAAHHEYDAGLARDVAEERAFLAVDAERRAKWGGDCAGPKGPRGARVEQRHGEEVRRNRIGPDRLLREADVFFP